MEAAEQGTLVYERELVRGSVRPGFAAVADEFERNFLERGDVGASFAAVVDGTPVVDLWGGFADRARQVPWREDTLCGIFSGTKGLVATCLLLLLDRGAIDLETPVCAYWPEFATNGKDDILVRHVVAHKSGLPGLTTPVTLDQATDPVHMARLLAEQRPITPPGWWHAYHAMTFGWLCAEPIRRIDGRGVGRFFAEEVAEPLGLEAWIGLPECYEGRVAVLERGEGFGPGMRHRDDGGPADAIVWSIWDNPPRFTDGGLAANSRTWRAAEIPSTNGIGTARSLARMYGCLACGGQLDGTSLVSPDTIDLARRCLARGDDPYLEVPMALGIGFQLQTELMPFGPEPDGFGHPGAGGSLHGAWRGLRTGFSYTTNKLGRLGSTDPRAQAVLAALHEAVSEAAGR